MAKRKGTIDYEAQERRIREIRAYAERELKLIRAERARREREQKER
jgi:hypothetical protein